MAASSVVGEECGGSCHRAGPVDIRAPGCSDNNYESHPGQLPGCPSPETWSGALLPILRVVTVPWLPMAIADHQPKSIDLMPYHHPRFGGPQRFPDRKMAGDVEARVGRVWWGTGAEPREGGSGSVSLGGGGGV